MRTAILFACCLFSGAQSWGQEKKPLNWSVGGGVGWFHYINTLKVGAGKVDNNQFGYTFRMMWEPEHRLAMGIESGYYTLYSIAKDSTSTNPLVGQAKLIALPLMLAIRMRILPNVYLSGGPGITIMYTEASVLGSSSQSSFMSLSNLHVSGMYRKRIGERLDIGVEAKYLYFGKTEDYGFSLQVVGAYHFRFTK